MARWEKSETSIYPSGERLIRFIVTEALGNDVTVRDDPEQVDDGWKATMELRLPGGADAAAVTVIADGSGLRVVTVMWREAR